jgi:hypothetical protein
MTTPNGTIHTTDRTTFKVCRLKWFFSSPLRMGYQPIKAQPALSFGTAWHKGMAAYYGGNREIGQAIDALQRSINGWYKEIENPTAEEDEEFADSLELGVGMLEHYGSFAPKHDDFEVLWVEKTFLIDIPGVEAPYSLTPDAVVRDRFGRHWIMEHKTAASLPTDTDYLAMDEQCGSYILGLKLATGIQAEGVIYNIARKKLPQPMMTLKDGHLSVKKAVDTTYDYALRQIDEHYGESVNVYMPMYAEFLERLQMKGERFFLRESIRRSRREIEILQDSIVKESSEMLNPELPIYRNPSKFACGNCPYVGPCLAVYEGADWESMLKDNYVKEDRRR